MSAVERACLTGEYAIVVVLLLGALSVVLWVSWWGVLAMFGAFLLGSVFRDLMNLRLGRYSATGKEPE